MNVDYKNISTGDAARMIGVDITTVSTWCREGRINCVNVSDGTKNGRYMLSEDEVDYIKTLKQKFGKQFIRKYRKDWKKGRQPAKTFVTDEVVEVVPVAKPVATIKSVVSTITEVKEESAFDVEEIALKISYIQDIKKQIHDLDEQKAKLTAELEELKNDVTKYL